MRVKLREGGRLVPGTSHKFWQKNIDVWKRLRKGESVEVDSEKFFNETSSERLQQYESFCKSKIANDILHGKVKKDAKLTLNEQIETALAKWKSNAEEVFFFFNKGLEKVEGGKKASTAISDQINNSGGEN